MAEIIKYYEDNKKNIGDGKIWDMPFKIAKLHKNGKEILYGDDINVCINMALIEDKSKK